MINIEDPSFNLDISKMFEKGGDCPRCNNKIKQVGAVGITMDNQFYFLVCKNCFKQSGSLKENRKQYLNGLMNKRLSNNIKRYCTKKVEDPTLGNLIKASSLNFGKDKKIKVTPNKTPWNEDDRMFFEKNNDKKFRARKVYDGEIEETYKDSEKMKESARRTCPKFAIVHKINKDQRVRIYVSDISNMPWKDERYLNALFQVSLNPNLNSNDIDKVYNEIKKVSPIVQNFDEKKEDKPKNKSLINKMTNLFCNNK